MCRPYCVRDHVSYTVKSSPPLIHTVSQALKTENMPDMASALMELILKRETVNNDTAHSQLLIYSCSKCHQREGRVSESMFMICPHLPISVAGTLVPANIYLSWCSAVSEQVSPLLLWPEGSLKLKSDHITVLLKPLRSSHPTQRRTQSLSMAHRPNLTPPPPPPLPSYPRC